jgi:hypothetical protein
MSTNWDSFVKRRSIDIQKFLSTNCIKTSVEFLAHLTKIDVEPPSKEVIDSIFPPPAPVVEKMETSFPQKMVIPGNVELVEPIPQVEKQTKQKSNNNVKK